MSSEENKEEFIINHAQMSRVMTIPQSGNLNSPPPSGRYPEVIFSAN